MNMMDHNAQSLHFTVGDGQLKAFRSSLLLLGKIGGNLMILAEGHQVCCFIRYVFSDQDTRVLVFACR
jgi:hypothetical protein